MSSFEWVPLGVVCDFENGDRGENYPSKSEFQKQGIPFLNAGNIADGSLTAADSDCITEEKYNSLRAGKVRYGDILFCLRGAIGKCAVSAIDKAAIASSLVIIRNKPCIDARYLYYVLMSAYFQKCMSNCDNGSVQGNMSVAFLKTINIPLPSFATQQIIAKVLGAIDDKIALNKKMMVELEDTARLIYDYWFTQFDFPDENGKPYRSSGGKMVYNETLKREIPEGWEAGLMSDLGSVVSGATPSTGDSSNYADEGIAWITPNDLSDNDSFMHISHGKRDVSGVGLASCSAVMMPAGSTIMSSRAPIGYLAVAETACCTNQGCKSLVADAGYPSYFNFFTVQRLMPLIRSQGAGTTFAEVSKEDFASVRLARPPKGMAERFEKSVLPLCEKSKRLQTETVELSSLRDWLLPMLMNGQVSISG